MIVLDEKVPVIGNSLAEAIAKNRIRYHTDRDAFAIGGDGRRIEAKTEVNAIKRLAGDDRQNHGD